MLRALLGRAVVSVLLVGLGLVGCQAQPEDRSEEPEAGSEDAARLAAEALPHSSDFQAAILEDGVVTQAEFDRAVAAALACMREQGVEAEFLLTADGRGGTWHGAGGDNAREVNEDFEIQEDCLGQFYDNISVVWYVAQTPTDPQRRAEDMKAFRACLEDAGVDVPAELTPESYHEALGRTAPEAGFEVQTEFNEVEEAARPCEDLYGYLLE